jgi:hypothetical protein
MTAWQPSSRSPKTKRGEYRFKLNALTAKPSPSRRATRPSRAAKKGVDRVKKHAGTAAVDDESDD